MAWQIMHNRQRQITDTEDPHQVDQSLQCLICWHDELRNYQTVGETCKRPSQQAKSTKSTSHRYGTKWSKT